jgi:hypothetical protein
VKKPTLVFHAIALVLVFASLAAATAKDGSCSADMKVAVGAVRCWVGEHLERDVLAVFLPLRQAAR